MKIYDLIPIDGRKSFYGKAKVYIAEDGTETLYSYNTPIARRLTDGRIVKLWNGWTMTTGRHINAFCGMNKKQFSALENAPEEYSSAGRTLSNKESYNAIMARRYNL